MHKGIKTPSWHLQPQPNPCIIRGRPYPCQVRVQLAAQQTGRGESTICQYCRLTSPRHRTCASSATPSVGSLCVVIPAAEAVAATLWSAAAPKQIRNVQHPSSIPRTRSGCCSRHALFRCCADTVPANGSSAAECPAELTIMATGKWCMGDEVRLAVRKQQRCELDWTHITAQVQQRSTPEGVCRRSRESTAATPSPL